jgi:hypothetical protein
VATEPAQALVDDADALRALRGRRGLLVAGGKRSSTYRTWAGFAAPGYTVAGSSGPDG